MNRRIRLNRRRWADRRPMPRLLRLPADLTLDEVDEIRRRITESLRHPGPIFIQHPEIEVVW